WSSGDTQLGQSIEDIVQGVFQDYLMETRELKPGVDIAVQLKNATRSELWSLVKRKGTRAIPIVEEGDEDEPPSAYATKTPSPDQQTSSSDLCRVILQQVWDHPKVKASDELKAYLLAVEV